MYEGKFPVPENHQIWLRDILSHDFPFIYMGDYVEVSERWAGDKENPLKGKKGFVIAMSRGLQGQMNVDYTVYRILPTKGNFFEIYYYTLDILRQAETNKKLEEFLRATLPEQ